ncbi:response regulator [Anaerolineales bacterium HSG24]|nr:response regulator [Anaerolineales bacterium HSG24]
MEKNKQIRLLIVEDSPNYLHELKEWLTIFGYQHIDEAGSAAEAKTKLQQNSYDIIITDMVMEEKDSGFSVIQTVKQQRATGLVIVLTANEDIQDCRAAIKNPYTWDYISKNLKGNVFEKIHQSIQEAIVYLQHWGDPYGETWINQNIYELKRNYPNKYVAVLNKTVIASSDTQEKLDAILTERHLPIFFTVTKKLGLPDLESTNLTFPVDGSIIDLPITGPLSSRLTVFVEGPTDVEYIRKAGTMLDKKDVLEQVHLDTIGDSTGGEGGGYKNLTHGFNFLRDNPGLRPNKVLFLYDQDVQDKHLPKKGHNIENLFFRRIGETYSPQQKGIEWLFDDLIFEEGFDQGFVVKDLGRVSVNEPPPIPSYIVKDKMAFCKWVCNTRPNVPNDFENFRKVFNIFSEILSLHLL